MGVLLAMFSRRRWIWLIGFALVVASLLVPEHSVIRWVLLVAGFGLIVIQVPIAMRSRRDVDRSGADSEGTPTGAP